MVFIFPFYRRENLTGARPHRSTPAILLGTLVLTGLILMGLTTCKLGSPGDPPGGWEEHSELFDTNTELYSGEGETWVFETNDPAFWTSAGYTLWARNDTKHKLGDSWNRSFSLTKESGDEAAGYGILFGYDDDPTHGTTMLVVMINLQAEYCVGELVGSSFQMVKGWTASEDLKGIKGEEDTVRITYDGDTKIYSVYLGENDTAAYSFEDTVEPYHDGGEEGFLAVISYNDDFPQTPVRVVYHVP
jgi:hypothetical protein